MLVSPLEIDSNQSLDSGANLFLCVKKNDEIKNVVNNGIEQGRIQSRFCRVRSGDNLFVTGMIRDA